MSFASGWHVNDFILDFSDIMESLNEVKLLKESANMLST